MFLTWRWHPLEELSELKPPWLILTSILLSAQVCGTPYWVVKEVFKCVCVCVCVCVCLVAVWRGFLVLSYPLVSLRCLFVLVAAWEGGGGGAEGGQLSTTSTQSTESSHCCQSQTRIPHHHHHHHHTPTPKNPLSNPFLKREKLFCL